MPADCIKIIDSHTHIYPPKIAEKATDAIGDFYSIPMMHVGISESLIKESRVSRFVVSSAATVPKQVRAINDFIAHECKMQPRFWGLATMHPDMDAPAEEVARLKSLHLRGVKLHPDFQQFNIDDERMFPIYELLSDAGLPVLFHTGDARYDYSSPSRLIRVAKFFPKLICIGAHFGGYQRWDDFSLYIKAGLENIYFDTASSLSFLEKEKAKAMILAAGSERFLYGSDFPMWDPSSELELILSLGFTDEQYENILHKNAEKIFGQGEK